MSRRGGREEIYEERGYYVQAEPPRAAPAARVREYEEVDYRRESSRGGGQPEFMRQEIVREEQPLVLRKREVESFQRRSPSPERERIRTREVVRERERERSPSVVSVVRERTRVVERERSPEPVYRTRVVERERERERERSPEPQYERVRTRVVERERERERTPSPPPMERERTRTTTIVRERERERSPSPERERIRTRIVERERERERSRSRSSSPSIIAQMEPPVIRAPPIHQEIITHHRHIDHGYAYEPAPTPPPPIRAPRIEREPPVQERTRETEIDIHTGRGETEIEIYKSSKTRDAPPPPRSEFGGRERERERDTRSFYDDDILIERDRGSLRVRERTSRRRSLSNRRPEPMADDQEEANYYRQKVNERAYIGEAYNGATKDWAIVDVPPGTERVKMDGIGGASQEISWQKYNGVRRSKFLPEREREREVQISTYEREEVSDRRVAPPLAPARNRAGDMWTEITKDLVVREAVEELGYDFEETEYFFYVMQYLRYEDVQELVLLSEHIRKERKRRIQEIAYERDRMEIMEREREREIIRRPVPAYEDERIIEREIIYDNPYRSRGYR